jgi:hypothetical protein
MIDLANDNQKEKRMEIMRKAMKEKAPLTYAGLEESGGLEKYLEAHDAEMMKNFQAAKDKAWEETLASSLDFFDPNYDETSSPM